jgi:hypothetical protein
MATSTQISKKSMWGLATFIRVRIHEAEFLDHMWGCDCEYKDAMENLGSYIYKETD